MPSCEVPPARFKCWLAAPARSWLKILNKCATRRTALCRIRTKIGAEPTCPTRLVICCGKNAGICSKSETVTSLYCRSRRLHGEYQHRTARGSQVQGHLE